MLSVEFTVTKGHPPEPLTVGHIISDRGLVRVFSTAPKYDRLMKNILASPVVLAGGKKLTAADGDAWIRGLSGEYRSYALRASDAVEGKNFDFDESKHPRDDNGRWTDGSDSGAKANVTEGSNTGPGFTPEQLKTRDATVKLLEAVGRNWMLNRTDGQREPTRKDVADMMTHLGQQYAAQVDSIIKDFDDYSKYPERPAVHLIVGEKGVPDVWLLGWRENEKGLEATPIHDHGPSEAGVYVHKGAVNERIFAIDKADFGKDTLGFHEVDRGLNSGSAITINAPYLHDIGAQEGAGTSVTIHGYYPPLNEMNFYEVKGKNLVKSGSWKEDPNVMKAKGFERSHVFPCFHYSTKKYHDAKERRFIRAYDWNEEDHPRAQDGKFTTGGGTDKAALQKHLVDYKEDRPLTGPGTAAISEIIPGAKSVQYMDVPGIDQMHAMMGIPNPTLDTSPDEYADAREALFKRNEPTDVPFDKLTFTQARINKDEVSKMPAQFQRKPVMVVKRGGQYYLMNGHHRVVGQYMMGDKTLPGYVLDLDVSKYHLQGQHDQQTHNPYLGKEQKVELESKFIMRRAAIIEPKVTNILKSSVNDKGGHLEGLDFKLKSEPSLRRKIDQKIAQNPFMTPTDAMLGVSDALRYTAIFPPDHYAEGVKNTLDSLKGQGLDVDVIKNYWEKGDDYDGINVRLKTPDDLKIELQFHTDESFDVKEKQSHPIYEKLRTATDPKEAKQYKDALVKLWSKVAVPAAALSIGNLVRTDYA